MFEATQRKMGRMSPRITVLIATRPAMTIIRRGGIPIRIPGRKARNLGIMSTVLAQYTVVRRRKGLTAGGKGSFSLLRGLAVYQRIRITAVGRQCIQPVSLQQN